MEDEAGEGGSASYREPCLGVRFQVARGQAGT